MATRKTSSPAPPLDTARKRRAAPLALGHESLGYDRADKRIDILRQVGRGGSISEAARATGISYKAAWQALHTLSGLAGTPVVESSVGGRGGGGARLTAAGQRLLHAAELMDNARRQVLAQVNASPADASAPALGAPRTSMRNLLRCTVHALHSKGTRDPIVNVQLALPGGMPLHASLTRESAELLGLVPGLPVLALCKATAVRILPGAAEQAGATGIPDSPGTSHASLLDGHIERIARGAQQDEVTLLIDGMPLTGFAHRPNRLRAGKLARALIDASAVVIALGD